MDFELTQEQRAIGDSLTKLLKQHAGAARARSLLASGGYDVELASALEGAGFLDVARAEPRGGLEAALVIEAVARHAGLVSCGASALVAPAVLGEQPPGPIALGLAGDPGPVRYGVHAN